MVVELLRPARGGFLRPFGCGWFIRELLLDSDLMRNQLLNELDELDYVLRDMLYLAIGRIDLNLPIVLDEFSQSPDGGLIIPNVFRVIEAASDYLCDQVFLGSEERCLQQLVEKAIVKEVMGGHLSVKDLIELKRDVDMERSLLKFKSGRVDLQDAVRRIKAGNLIEVVSIPVDPFIASLLDVEMDLAGTNKAGVNSYCDRRGIYVQCRPSPYYGVPAAFEFTESECLASVVYDLSSQRPASVISALIRAEGWLPMNAYGMKTSYRQDALRFLFGLDIQPHFDRYYDILAPVVEKHLPSPGDELKPEFFSESWSLQNQAPELLSAFEDELGSRVKHFIEFPEHWSTAIIKEVLNSIKNAFSTTKKKRREDEKSYEARKEKLLEYLTYLETVLRIQEKGLIGWAIPSVWILEKDGSQFREVDVVAIYVEREFHGLVRIEMLAVSTNDSLDNRENNRRKLRDVAHKIIARFNRGVQVEGFFNGGKVVPPY